MCYYTFLFVSFLQLNWTPAQLILFLHPSITSGHMYSILLPSTSKTYKTVLSLCVCVCVCVFTTLKNVRSFTYKISSMWLPKYEMNKKDNMD